MSDNQCQDCGNQYGAHYPGCHFNCGAEIERLRAKVERLESRGITDMQHEIERLRAALEEAEDGPCDETGDWTMRCGDCANCIIRRALDGEA